MRLIIVDDEYFIRKRLIQSIPWGEIGYEVVGEAEDGVEALDRIAGLQPDAALIDINLPRMSGLELIQGILSASPYVSVVILTAYDRFSYAKDAIRLNVFDYLLKPINQAEIINTFERLKPVIEKRRAEREAHSLRGVDSGQGCNALVDSIRRDILAEYWDPELSIGLLAGRYHVNQNYMCTLYKRNTGSTIIDDLIDRRIRMAQAMILEKPSLSFASIAHAVGYADPLYFSKAFKKKVGVSPRQFRNQQAK